MALLLKELQLFLQVEADVGWLHGFHRGMPLIEMGEEPFGYDDPASCRLRGISLLLQMFCQLD